MATSKVTMIGMYNYDNTIFDGLTFPTGIDKSVAVEEILIRSGEFEVLYPNITFLKSMITHWGTKHYRTFEKWITVLSEDYDPLYNYDGHEEIRDEERFTNGKSHDVTDTASGSHDYTRTDSGSHDVTKTSTGEHDVTRTSSGEHDYTKSASEEHDVTNTASGQHDTTTTTDMTLEKTTSAYDTTTYSPDAKEDNDGTVRDAGTDSKTIRDAGTQSGTERDAGSQSGTERDAGTQSGSERDAGTENMISRDAGTDGNTLRSAGSESENGSKTFIHTLHRYGNQGTTMSQQMLQAELDVQRFSIYENIADLFIDEFCVMVYA